MIFELSTNLSLDERNEIMTDTFRRWISFALGLNPFEGEILKHPSGRYASALRLQRLDEYRFAIYVPTTNPNSVQEYVMMHGHREIHLKDKMLASSKAKVSLKPDKFGRHTRYRDIPIRQASRSPLRTLESQVVLGKELADMGPLWGRGKEGIKRKLARMWATEYQSAYEYLGEEESTITDISRSVPQRHWKANPPQSARFKMTSTGATGPVKFRRMSDKPGSKPWVIKAMPAFNPVHILRQQLGDKIVSIT